MALADDSILDLLGPFTTDNAIANDVNVHNSIYLPDPYVVMFIDKDLLTAEDWSILQGYIINAGSKMVFFP